MINVLQSFEELDQLQEPIFLAAGFFDGIHLGHKQVIKSALSSAERVSGQVWVLTFEPHPLKLLSPEHAPPLLTSTAHKLKLLTSTHVDGCIMLPFTPKLANQEPEDFLTELQYNIPTLKGLTVGENWTFGRRARGNTTMLQKLAPSLNLNIDIVPPVLYKNEPVSSTRIRHAILNGHLSEAADMLGHPFSIYGNVIKGQQVGRQLGFPTANIYPENEVRPPAGVYASYAMIEGKRCNGAAFHPDPNTQTFGNKDIVEIFLFDFDGDIYGEALEVFFTKKIRDARIFPSYNELKIQIEKDIAEIQRFHASGRVTYANTIHH